MQRDKTNDLHSKDRQTASLTSLETLKELVKSELQNCSVSDDPELSTITKRAVCPYVVMNERHKMARNRLQPLKAKLFPSPSELKFMPTNKIIRDEKSKVLHEKEKRFVARAIIQLEREFLSRRNRATLSLLELEKQNKGRIHPDVHEVRKKKDISNYNDPVDFLTNIQKSYERLHRNLSRSQYFETVPEKQKIISHDSRNESFGTTCPTTLTEKGNTNNEVNGNFHKLSPITPTGKETKNNQKMENADCKLNKIDFCHSGVVAENPDQLKPPPTEMPADDCPEKMGNADEQAHKWKTVYYWRMWREVILKKKKENQKLQRIEKIDSFLTRLTKAAEQVQQLQKLANEVARQSSQKKLVPQTNPRKKLLGESEETEKLDRIEKELTESTAEAYERLNKGLKMFHPNLQPKLKALSVLSTVKKYRIVGTETRRVYPTPAFVTEMENRYKERKTRWEKIRKKRLEMEVEKERIMREREEEEKKLENLKKREKLEKLKEKRRREKEAEEERKRERRLLKQQLRLAQDHYARYLMMKVGFQSLQRLIQLRRNQMESAYHHIRVRTCSKHLMHWRKFTVSQLNQKQRKAQELYEKLLLNKSLHSWMSEHIESVHKIQVAVDWSEAKLAERAFAMWADNAQAERWYFIRKTEFADSIYDRKLLARCIIKWKEFPELVKNEKEKQKRKKNWQRKVQEFLPDYQPAFISEI